LGLKSTVSILENTVQEGSWKEKGGRDMKKFKSDLIQKSFETGSFRFCI
jgi:hypothetical protein